MEQDHKDQKDSSDNLNNNNPNTMRCTTRDYYHTAYSLDIDVDRHRTINFEGDGGVQMLSCGHCLHIDCYQRFLAHQINQQQNGPNMHPHQHLLELNREFFCPLCRRLGNALLPISLMIPEHRNIKEKEKDVKHNDKAVDKSKSNDNDNKCNNNANTDNTKIGIQININSPLPNARIITSNSLPSPQELNDMIHKNRTEMAPLIRDSIKQLIRNIARHSPAMTTMSSSQKSIEWLRFTLLFNIRLIENSLRYDSYTPIKNATNNKYELVTDHIYKIQKSFLSDIRLETLYLLSRVIIYLSNHGQNYQYPHSLSTNLILENDAIQLDRIIRGFFATGWVFDTSPLEIATRVLCMNWEYLPIVAQKFDQLCVTILLTYMGRIIYFLIRWSRATFDNIDPACLEFIKYLPQSNFIRFIFDVNIKRFNRHTEHIRKHKSYAKYCKSSLRSNKQNTTATATASSTPSASLNNDQDNIKSEEKESKEKIQENSIPTEAWSKEKILDESKWFINSIQWFCLPLLRHLAIMKHIIFKLVYNMNKFGDKINLTPDILSLVDINDAIDTIHNVTPSGKKVNDDSLILSPLRIVFEYHSWSNYLLLPSILNILTFKWNKHLLGTPYSTRHTLNVSQLSPLQQSQLLYEENPYWDKFIPPELLGIFRAPMSPLPFMLKRLPSLYQTLYTTILYKKCNRCQRVPNEAGLCLTCHRLICFRGDCCKNSKNQTFETYDHMMSCGGGLGGVVHLKMGSILLVAHKRRCLWYSLYLDEHGEEDKWLKRGHPLRISPLRFSQLEKMFVDGSFVHHNAELWVTDARGY